MLKKKGQRTVYRLTLVKEFNMTEVADYCNLIELGAPDFIEIKVGSWAAHVASSNVRSLIAFSSLSWQAVTYCGKSDGSSLTMKHVPWHEEVKAFAAAIAEKTNGKYGLAAEHEHSNCTLLAKQKFKVAFPPYIGTLHHFHFACTLFLSSD